MRITTLPFATIISVGFVVVAHGGTQRIAGSNDVAPGAALVPFGSFESPVLNGHGSVAFWTPLSGGTARSRTLPTASAQPSIIPPVTRRWTAAISFLISMTPAVAAAAIRYGRSAAMCRSTTTMI